MFFKGPKQKVNLRATIWCVAVFFANITLDFPMTFLACQTKSSVLLFDTKFVHLQIKCIYI